MKILDIVKYLFNNKLLFFNLKNNGRKKQK